MIRKLPMRAIFFNLTALILILSPAALRAEQYASGDHIVHTRLAPVIAHRIVPPYRGVHVYEGRAVRR
jgi:hypothetical protein